MPVHPQFLFDWFEDPLSNFFQDPLLVAVMRFSSKVNQRIIYARLKIIKRLL